MIDTNQMLRQILLVGLLAFFAISLYRGLLDERERTGLGPVVQLRAAGDPGIRVLLMNHLSPTPTGTQDQLDISIQQPVDLYAPTIPDANHRITLDANSVLHIAPDASTGLLLSCRSWPKEIAWPVAVIRLQPHRTEPPMPAGTDPSTRLNDVFEAADREAVYVLPGGNRYRGSLDVVWRSPKDIAAIGVLPLESYLAGVVAVEMSPSYPAEALKAQAIASRGFALARLREARAAGRDYDLKDTDGDQEYRGADNDNAAVQGAVADTEGVVMVIDHDHVFAPQFCASSGGYTEAIDNVFPGARDASGQDSLSGVMPAMNDPYCHDGAAGLGALSRYWNAVAIVPFSDIQAKLTRVLAAQNLPPIGYIRRLDVTRDPRSGRILTVQIQHSLGVDPLIISGARFRDIIGSDLRSTRWSLDSPKKVDEIDGHRRGGLRIETLGWGHGVGMSQASAWEMANAKMSCATILKFFYQDVSFAQEW